MNTNHTQRKRGLLLIALLVLFLAAEVVAQQPAPSQSPFCDGEHLRYAVHYGFIRIGTVDIRQKRCRVNGRTAYVVTIAAASSKGLPFVDVRRYDRTVLDPSDPLCRKFDVQQQHAPRLSRRYRYDPSRQLFSVETREAGQPSRRISRKETRSFYDGLGLVMRYRMNSGSGLRSRCFMVNDTSIVTTEAYFDAHQEMMEVEAFEDEVAVRKTLVRADWHMESIAGLDGNFDVWCTADAAAVPVRIEVDLAFGAIVMELEHISRRGWEAGQGNELVNTNGSSGGKP